MQPAETRYPIRERELLAIVLALKQWFHLLRGPQQVHVHTDHESVRYLKTCPRPLTPRQARWSQFLEEYNLTLWYVPGLENPAADACSRLTSQQLMDIENATRTRAFVIPLVENWASPEGEPVDEFFALNGAFCGWPGRGERLLPAKLFFGEGREPETKFNHGLSTAARCCSLLPYLNETWQPRYRQPQSRGLCLISEGGTVAAWGSEHDGLSSTSG